MITLTDLFCGAGGSSTGAVQVPGVAVRVASNHWRLAVDTHEANHPDTGHVCADLSQIDPRFYPRTDILWASPECTNHSIAKGKAKAPQPDLFNPVPDAAAERSRATMWDVPRFTEVHSYAAVIVENVVDVTRWAPYRSWLLAMDSLGYDHEVVYLNSMHAWAHGPAAPQSRDRFYAVFWRKGNRRPDLQGIQQPPAYCPEHGIVRARKAWKNAGRAGRYRAQYRFICPEATCRGRIVEPAWLPAASIIDWADVGTRIGDRAKPLAEKTMRRIQAGIDRYWGGPGRDPLVVNHVSGADSTRSTSVREVAPTMVAGGLHASLLVPVEGRDGKTARPVTEPYRTQTARNETGLLVVEAAGNTYDAADPKHPAHGRDDGYMRVWPGEDPLRTVHTTASKGIVCAPFIAELRGGGSDARSADDPLATVTASGNHHALVTSYYGRGTSRPVDDALPTVTTVDTHALIMTNNHENRARPADEPMPTQTTTQALIMRNNTPRGDAGYLSTPVDEPLRTIATAGHQSLILRGESGRVPTPTQGPIGTVTAAGSQFLATEGATVDIDDCFFRMLSPHEIQQAMAFPAEYQLLGTKRDQVRMAGNAVTPPAARDLIAAVAASLDGAA